MNTILLVDDHALFRHGMSMLLTSATEARVIEAGSMDDVIHIQQSCQVVLLDIQLPTMTGYDAVDLIYEKWPQAKIVMLSSVSINACIQSLIDSERIAGYVHKNADPSVVLDMVLPLLATSARTKHDDQGSVEQARDKFEQSQSHTQHATRSAMPKHKSQEIIAQQLSERLKGILYLVAKGDSNKVIAAKLEISENTVRNQLVKLMETFDANSRTQLVMRALEYGYIGPNVQNGDEVLSSQLSNQSTDSHKMTLSV